MLTSAEKRAQELALIDAAVAAGRVTRLPPSWSDPWVIAQTLDPDAPGAVAIAAALVRRLLDLDGGMEQISRAVGLWSAPSGTYAAYRSPSPATAAAILRAAQNGALVALRNHLIARGAERFAAMEAARLEAERSRRDARKARNLRAGPDGSAS